MRKRISDEVLNFMARKFRLLSDPTRLAILRTLMAQGEQSVGQIVEETRASQTNVSKHLKQLRAAGFVAREKRVCASCTSWMIQ